MTVYLVGAGPGDPGLLTVRARELIAAADVILHDRLIPPGALDGARADAELIDVGKVGGGPQVPQEETERQLLAYGASGRTVVRLKGGDPFVFGRGGEEALALREAGIPFEVVPGVTAGIAAPAYAGIPVTQRDVASAVAFVTGHEDPSKPETALDWPALAAFPGTLVFYMGVKALPRIAERLVAGGRNAAEPVAVVERGTLPGQRTFLGSLGDIAEEAAQARAPAITLVGPVAALHERIAWLEDRPLHGRTVAVTRARAQASALAARLRELGADVVEAPAIAIRPLEAALPEDFDLLCVTSPNGAERLFELVRDARALAGVTVAAIGPGTARALRERGIEPDVRARARRGRRARRGAARRPVPARRDRAREGGSRRAPRRAALARRGRGRRALRDHRRAPVGGDPVGGRGRRLRALHERELGPLLRVGGRRAVGPPARLDRPRDERRAARARRRAGHRGRPAHPGRHHPGAA